PSVRFCTRIPGRYAVRLQMTRGGGGYYLALFEGPSNANPRVAAYFAGHEVKEPTVQVARIDRATQARVDALSRTLTGEGYTAVGPTQGLTLGGALSREFGLNLRPDRCYVFATLAGPGVGEANTTILSDEVEEIASGEASGRYSVVVLCPPHGYEVTLRY